MDTLIIILLIPTIIHALFDLPIYHTFLEKYNIVEHHKNTWVDIFRTILSCPPCLTFWVTLIVLIIMGINPLFAYFAYVIKKIMLKL